MRRALALSPRVGDAVFGCGATLAGLAGGGWHVTLVTAFAPGDPAVRDEDHVAAHLLGLADVVQLAPPPTADRAAGVAAALGPALDAALPDRLFAPLEPVDAQQRAAIDGLAWLGHPAPVVRWRDLRTATGRPLPDERGIPIAAALLERKLAACAAYASLRPDPEALRAAHAREAARLGVQGAAEALLEPPRDRRRRRPGSEADDRAALVRALRGATRG